MLLVREGGTGTSRAASPEVIAPTPQDYEAFLRRYSRRGDNGAQGPLLFVKEICLAGVTEPVDPNDPLGPQRPAAPDEWQEEALLAYGRFERRIARKSGHGVGKTALLAWIIVHHALTEFPQKTAITAPTSHQMFDALWPEIIKWFQRCPPAFTQVFDFKSDRIEHTIRPKESFISATTARPESPEALAGIHCEDGSVLLVADEASGIHEAIFESASGSMSGHNATTILAGNPVRTAGLFFDVFGKLRDLWNTATINCETSTRVSRDFIEDMARRYGRDSNAYNVRVKGEFPTGDADTIIPYELVAAAQNRDVTPNPEARVTWGLDVARFGNDRSVLAKRRQNRLLERPKVWRDKDVMQLAALIHEEWLATPTLDRPDEICVDSIGIGGGVADRLRQLELPARDVNVSESPSLTERYANLKAELWFQAKEWFQRLDCQIPPDDEHALGGTLGAELTLPRFRFTRTGKLQVESKDEIKRRGHPSPDLADAFVLTMAGMATTVGYGQAARGWNAPAIRKLSIF